jgi:hypothetical protein
MKDEFATKTKESSNGKWVPKQEAQMDNEAVAPSTLSMPERSASQVYDRVVSRGSEILSKVDLSRGTNLLRDYPIRVSLGGMILGFLLGAFVFRRRE